MNEMAVEKKQTNKKMKIITYLIQDDKNCS